MPLYLGVDDTDSLRGMCTTFLATELVRALPKWDLIGFPRLVRLNPNIPWKTRGNGASCLRPGKGPGRGARGGMIAGAAVWAPEPAAPPPPSEEVARIAAGVVERWSALEDPTTNPALVLLRKPPPPGLYWRTVRDIVAKREGLRAIRGLGVRREGKNGRGVIGAAAAAGWRPPGRAAGGPA